MSNLEKLKILCSGKEWNDREKSLVTLQALFRAYMDLFYVLIKEFEEFDHALEVLTAIKNRTEEQCEEMRLLCTLLLSNFRSMDPLIRQSINNRESFKDILIQQDVNGKNND